MFYDFIVTMVTPIFYFYSGKPIIIGKENLQYVKDGSAIICSNHKSNWDPIILGMIFRFRHLNFMAKKELFQKNKFASWFLKKMMAFPIDRDTNDISAVKYALKIVRDGHVFAIFPEGKRNKENTLLEFKQGFPLIAHRAKTKVIPVGIKNNVGWFKRAVIEIGKPIDFDKYYSVKSSQSVFEQMNKDLYDAIYKLAIEPQNNISGENM